MTDRYRLDEALFTELGYDAYVDLVIQTGPVEHLANLIRYQMICILPEGPDVGELR